MTRKEIIYSLGSAASAGALLFGVATVIPQSISTLTPTQVETAEELYNATHGGSDYLQVKQGNVLSEGATGTVPQYLGGNLPADMRVDVYGGPAGTGYQVFYEDAQNYYSKGYGPEASSRTWTRAKPSAPATSTP